MQVQAIDSYEQSLVLVPQIDVSDEFAATGRAMMLDALGAAYYSIGEVEQAIGHFERGLEMAKSLQMTAPTSRILIELGAAFHSLGESERAIEYTYRNYCCWLMEKQIHRQKVQYLAHLEQCTLMV